MALRRVLRKAGQEIQTIREGDRLLQKPPEANPVLTISAVLDKAHVCVVLRASYIGPVNDDDQPGFEVSTKLSDRHDIIARTRQEITTDGMFFATDCGSSGVQALTGNVIFQAFYTALGVGKIWGNPQGIVIPSDFWTAPLQVNFYPDQSDQFDSVITLEGNDITANSGTIYGQVTFGRQPLRSIELTISIQAFPDRFSPGTTKNFPTFNVTNAERNSEGIFKHTITDSIFALNLGIITANLSATDNGGTTETARQRYAWDKSNFLQIVPPSITVNGGIGEKGVYTLRLANVVVEEEDIILSDSSWASLTYDKDNRTFTITTTSFNLSNDSRSIIISISKNGLSASATFTQESGQSLTRPTISFVGSRSQTITRASGQSKDYELRITNPDNLIVSLMLTGPQLTLDTANQRWNIADWGHAAIVTENNKTLVRATSITENTGNQRQTTFQAGLIFNFIGGQTTSLTQQATFIQQGSPPPTIRTEPVVITIDDDVVAAQTYEVIVTNADVSGVVLGSIEDWVTATISGTTLTITPKSVNPSSSARRVANIQLTITNPSGSATTQAFLVQRPKEPEPVPTIRVSPTARTINNDVTTAQTYTITVTNGLVSNIVLSSIDNWLTASISGNILTLRPTSINTSTNARIDNVVLTLTTVGGTATASARLTQRGRPAPPSQAPSIRVSPTSRTISNDDTSGQIYEVTVTNGFLSQVTISGVASWNKASLSGSTLTITPQSENTASNQRTDSITLTITNSGGTASTTATLTQQGLIPSNYAPQITYNNPNNGIIQQTSNAGFNARFTIRIDALPSTITDHEFNNLSAGAWTNINYNNSVITADVSTNTFTRQRNTAVSIRLQNSEGWGNWLPLEVRQGPAPSISITPESRRVRAQIGQLATYIISTTGGVTIDSSNISLNQNWASLSLSGSTLTLTTTSANTGTAERSLTISISKSGLSASAVFRQSGTILLEDPEVTLQPGLRSVNFLSGQSSTFTYEIANPDNVTINSITIISDDVNTDSSIGGWSNNWGTVNLSGNNQRGTITARTKALNQSGQRTLAFQVRITFGSNTHTSSEGIFTQGGYQPLTVSPTSWRPPPEASSRTFTVGIGPRNRGNIRITDSEGWITTPSTIDALLRFTASVMANTLTIDRQGSIRIQALGETSGVNVFVNQQKKALPPPPTININPRSYTIDHDDLVTRTFAVTLTNATFDQVSIEDNVMDDWTTWAKDDANETITVTTTQANTSTNDRTDTVIINVITPSGRDSSDISLLQRGVPEPMISITPTSQTIDWDHLGGLDFTITLSNFELTYDADGFATNVSISSTIPVGGIGDFTTGIIEVLPSQSITSAILRIYGFARNFSESDETYEVTLTITNENSVSASDTITITQTGNPNSPTITINPTSQTTAHFTTTLRYDVTLTLASFSQVSIQPDSATWTTWRKDNTNEQIVVNVDSNRLFVSRTSTATITVQTSTGSDSQVISITQSALPTIPLSVKPPSWSPGYEATTEDFTITGTRPYTLSRDPTTATWITWGSVNSDGEFTGSVSENTGSAVRSGKIVISSSPTNSVELPIRQNFDVPTTSVTGNISPDIINIAPAYNNDSDPTILTLDNPKYNPVKVNFTITSNDLSKIAIILRGRIDPDSPIGDTVIILDATPRVLNRINIGLRSYQWIVFMYLREVNKISSNQLNIKMDFLISSSYRGADINRPDSLDRGEENYYTSGMIKNQINLIAFEPNENGELVDSDGRIVETGQQYLAAKFSYRTLDTNEFNYIRPPRPSFTYSPTSTPIVPREGGSFTKTLTYSNCDGDFIKARYSSDNQIQWSYTIENNVLTITVPQNPNPIGRGRINGIGFFRIFTIGGATSVYLSFQQQAT